MNHSFKMREYCLGALKGLKYKPSLNCVVLIPNLSIPLPCFIHIHSRKYRHLKYTECFTKQCRENRDDFGSLMSTFEVSSIF